MDITSLCTVIPNGEGFLALKHFFELCTVKEQSSKILLCLAEIVLTLNCFSFAGNYFIQINGDAMGTKMRPSYANLFVGCIENKIFNQHNGFKPVLYCRYIDDCFGATSSAREDLNTFKTAVNSFHPALKYTWEISDTSLAFLDIKFRSKVTVYALACATDPQILIVTCCIHLHIHHMSRIPFLILIFLDFVVFVVTTLIFH